MKKIKIISVLLLTLTVNSVAANAAVTTTKNKDGSVTITDTTTGTVTDIVNDDGSPVTDEQIAKGIADNASTNTNTNKSTNTTNSAAVNVLKPVQNGWAQDSNGYWYYYVNGVLQTGWVQYNGEWYFLEPNGMMATNQYIGNNYEKYYNSTKFYYVGLNGKFIENVTRNDEHEPAYGTVTLTHPTSPQSYYKWRFEIITYKYESQSNKWIKVSTVGASDTSNTQFNIFDKYAEQYKKPTDKGKDGEERKVSIWVYLGEHY